MVAKTLADFEINVPPRSADLKNYPNIEDFLNLLEMAKSFNSEEFIESSLWSKAWVEGVKDVTMKAVTDYLWENRKRRRSQSDEASRCEMPQVRGYRSHI